MPASDTMGYWTDNGAMCGNFDVMFWTRCYSVLCHPPHAMRCVLRSARAHQMLIGTCDPMACLDSHRQVRRPAAADNRQHLAALRVARGPAHPGEVPAARSILVHQRCPARGRGVAACAVAVRCPWARRARRCDQQHQAATVPQLLGLGDAAGLPELYRWAGCRRGADLVHAELSLSEARPNAGRHLAGVQDTFPSPSLPPSPSRISAVSFAVTVPVPMTSCLPLQVAPADAAAFFRCAFADHASEMMAAEVDFLNWSQLTVPAIFATLDGGHMYLAGLASAAAELGISHQLCMALPSQIMDSLLLPAVTNARASPDNVPGTFGSRWLVGYTSMLMWPLHVAPFTDNSWTEAREPGNPYGANRTDVELQWIMSTLTAGPVGLADGIGSANGTRVLQASSLALDRISHAQLPGQSCCRAHVCPFDCTPRGLRPRLSCGLWLEDTGGQQIWPSQQCSLGGKGMMD